MHVIHLRINGYIIINYISVNTILDAVLEAQQIVTYWLEEWNYWLKTSAEPISNHLYIENQFPDFSSLMNLALWEFFKSSASVKFVPRWKSHSLPFCWFSSSALPKVHYKILTECQDSPLRLPLSPEPRSAHSVYV